MSLSGKNEALVWVCAHPADIRTLAPLQSEATLCRLTLPLEHATLKSRAHRHCTCTVDVAQAEYKYSCTVSVQEGGLKQGHPTRRRGCTALRLNSAADDGKHAQRDWSCYQAPGALQEVAERTV